MDVFIGRRFETNQKGVGKTECRWKESKITPQTKKHYKSQQDKRKIKQ